MDGAGGNSGPSDTTQMSPSENSNNYPGCGCVSGTTIAVRVTPTTGGQFELQVPRTESVENLKKLISKKLKVPKERICLLHRERQLREGTLQENQLTDGSRLTLLPSVETGLLAQRPEQSVMQALESLNDSQVNDFLSGKAPLNLTMRLGDHMMLIQLQLSTVTPSSSRRSGSTSSQTNNTSTNTTVSHPPSRNTSFQQCQNSKHISTPTAPCSGSASATSQMSSAQSKPLSPSSDERETSQAAASSAVNSQLVNVSSNESTPNSVPEIPTYLNSPENPTNSDSPSRSSNSASFKVPYSKTTSKTLQTSTESKCTHSSSLSAHWKSIECSGSSNVANSNSKSTVDSSSANASSKGRSHSPCLSTSTTPISECKCEPPSKPTLDTRALAEASRNLTQTLKQLSSEVLTSRTDSSEDNPRIRRQGAIIESMHHHGKGVYSGTFSGTLNPALQDRYGRPKRDISTIIHILNDLLCATPQYRRHARQGHTITLETSPQKPGSGATEKSQELGDEADSLSQENQSTKSKLEQLRLIMEERRARRKARRAARSAPYTTQWSATSESLQNPGPMVGSHDSNEAMETDLCELTPPEPVVA